MSEKLLIVEDDKKLNDGIRLALKNDAYFFYQCRTLQEAREILKKEDITLVLLDVNLPDGNGIDFVREIRKNSLCNSSCTDKQCTNHNHCHNQ